NEVGELDHPHTLKWPVLRGAQHALLVLPWLLMSNSGSLAVAAPCGWASHSCGLRTMPSGRLRPPATSPSSCCAVFLLDGRRDRLGGTRTSKIVQQGVA